MPDANAAARSVLILADLHLMSTRPAYSEAFERFLTGPARDALAVYILGDLFDVWVGDDAGVRDHPRECAALRALTRAGVPVYLMHGNRDFMIGKAFAKQTGVKLLADPARVELPDGPVVLSHGDLLCTADRRYQRYRKLVHRRGLQRLFMCLPVRLRRRLGGGLRTTSQANRQREGMSTINDVDEAAVRSMLADQQCTRLIHGHTHRPAQHSLELNGQPALRFVLADWRPTHMEYLACDARGWRRMALPLEHDTVSRRDPGAVPP